MARVRMEAMSMHMPDMTSTQDRARIEHTSVRGLDIESFAPTVRWKTLDCGERPTTGAAP